MSADGSEPPGSSLSTTSLRIRRAITGDAASVAWIVDRFSPALLAQARFRLGPTLRRYYEPEDFVADVWAVALRRLGDLRAAAESSTGVLVRYLGTVLLRRIRDVARLAAVRRAAPADGRSDGAELSQLDATTTSIVSRAVRDERSALLVRAIEELSPPDRQVVILRGIEGVSVAETATLMNATPSAVAVRYHRALKKLKDGFPDSVLAELAED
ncbi:MAG TPA: sigma-70 family RNA polymerase sigma factor [Planctomycetota bacterium]|nr:sigma-70 family RNA polymerase sigma factor [Planctomycetota bacterium]